jgi:hypothetical protein
VAVISVRSTDWDRHKRPAGLVAALVKGSIVCAAEGDLDSARRARPVAAWLIEEHAVDKPGTGDKRGTSA